MLCAEQLFSSMKKTNPSRNLSRDLQDTTIASQCIYALCHQLVGCDADQTSELMN
jgi:hypothetical protein